jgi:hypothetical protein
MNIASPQPRAPSRSGLSSSFGPFGKGRNRFSSRSRHKSTHRPGATSTIYQIADRLHERRTVRVAGDDIVTTVSAWLAELGTQSPLVENLAHAVRADDWPAVYVIGERLSVDVTVAASPARSIDGDAG